MSLVGKKVKRTGHMTKTWSIVCHDLKVSKTSAFLVLEDFHCHTKNKRVLKFESVRGTWPREYFSAVLSKHEPLTLESLL